MSAELKGSDYRALQRLSDGDDVTLAEVGETCDRVPVTSLSWLLAQGVIEPVAVAWTDLGRPQDEVR